MRVALTIDGKARSVDVDLSAGTVVVDGVLHPVKVLDAAGERAELEIDGERVLVEGWPAGLAQPLKDLSVNGERVSARIDDRSADLRGSAGSEGGSWGNAQGATPSSAPAPETVGPGVVIRPPMPGKVIEVRVQEGATVVAGQVLLVLEAMKMRNDVVAPAAGVVHDLRVVAGSNVRTREPMLRIEPA